MPSDLNRRTLIAGLASAAVIPSSAHAAPAATTPSTADLDRQIRAAAEYLQYCLNRRYGDGYRMDLLRDKQDPDGPIFVAMVHKC